MSDTLVRIARAQLSGLSRERTVVPAGPFTGLLVPDGPAFLSYAVASVPGAAVGDAAESVTLLEAAFPHEALRFELIEQVCPGAVEALTAVGLSVTGRYPLLTLASADAIVPVTPPGVVVRRVETMSDATAAAAIAAEAFDSPGFEASEPGLPEDGGTVLALVDGEPAAVASWTPVSDGVSEVAGVGTLVAHRGRGLGTLVTAHAVRHSGTDLTWLTPGGPDADRVYRRVGFLPDGNAVHLA